MTAKTKNEMIPAGEQTNGVQAVHVAGWSAVRNLAEAIQLAEIVAKSVAIPDVRNAGQALVKILAGAEMGFGPFASLVDVHIIEGKPAIGAKLMAAAIKRSGVYDYAIRRLDAEACELEFFCRGKNLGTVGYTMEEARRAGVSTKSDGKTLKANWQRHPDDMLFARCVSKGFRRHCPDLCGGVGAYDPDELGQAVDAEYTVTPPAPAEPAPGAPAEGLLPEGVVARFGELVRLLGLNVDKLRDRLKEQYGTDSFRSLGVEQAEEVVAKLEARLAEQPARPS